MHILLKRKMIAREEGSDQLAHWQVIALDFQT